MGWCVLLFVVLPVTCVVRAIGYVINKACHVWSRASQAMTRLKVMSVYVCTLFIHDFMSV